jgi:hypothetical protein
MRLLRAPYLVASAFSDFFDSEDDVIALGNWFEGDPPPSPAAEHERRSLRSEQANREGTSRLCDSGRQA